MQFGIIIKRSVKNFNIEDTVQVVSLFVIIAYLISAMFGNSMFYTSPYFFVFLGFLMMKPENNRLDKVD